VYQDIPEADDAMMAKDAKALYGQVPATTIDLRF
jgi:hypothetical protein